MEEKKFSVHIRWGDAATRAETTGPPSLYSFDTQAELDAFCLGIDDACGWSVFIYVCGKCSPECECDPDFCAKDGECDQCASICPCAEKLMEDVEEDTDETRE